MQMLLTLLAMVVFVSGPVRAQAPQAAPKRVAVWVALAPQQQTEPYRILRFGGNAPHDVILLRSPSDAGTLSQAVGALLAVRRAGGDVAGIDAAVRVSGTASVTRAPLPWADRVVRDVHGAELRQVPRVGRVKAVRIWLPVSRPS